MSSASASRPDPDAVVCEASCAEMGPKAESPIAITSAIVRIWIFICIARETTRPPRRGGLVWHLSLRSQRKHPERSAGRGRSQPLIAGEEPTGAADAARDRDILPAVLLPGDRLPLDP